MNNDGSNNFKKEYEYFGYPRCSTSSTYSQSGLSSNESSVNNIRYLNIQPMQEEYLGFNIYESLKRHGVCVIDNFLKEDSAKQLHKIVENLSSFEGLLHDPMMNAPSKSGTTARYRDDYITWLSGKENGYPCLDNFTSCLHKVVKLFYRYSLTQNKKYSITHKSMIQASCFPPQSMGYRLHSDNPDGNGRLLTFVYHCNKGYDLLTCGGTVRFFINTKYADVHPRYNRLVVYWSNSMVEMLPCQTSLYSLTVWYFGNLIEEEKNDEVSGNDSIQYHNF